MFALAVLLGAAPLYRALPQTASDSILPRRPYLGVRLGVLPDSLARRGATGVAATSVTVGSPADRAGITAGDLLVRINRIPLSDVAQTLEVIRGLRAGQAVVVTTRRGAREQTLSLVLVEWPSETPAGLVVSYEQVRLADGRRRVIVVGPPDSRRHPAVLLVGEIGCYSIDAPWGRGLYNDLLYHVSRRGFVTVRVEKSGIGDSEGPRCAEADLTSEQLSYDAALQAVRRYPYVDSTHVVLLGHGAGGMLAARLAQHASGTVAGIAVVAGYGVPWFDHELGTLKWWLVLAGIPPDSIDPMIDAGKRCGEMFFGGREDRRSFAASHPACEPYLSYSLSASSPACHPIPCGAAYAFPCWWCISRPTRSRAGTNRSPSRS